MTITETSAPTAVIPFSELFEALSLMSAEKERLTGLAKTIDADIAGVRSAIADRIRESGSSSYTDAATGINASISRTKTWRVTDPVALMAAAKSCPELDLIRVLETVDTAKAIELAKSSVVQLNGIEQVEGDERLTIRQPKTADRRNGADTVEQGDALTVRGR